MDISPIFLAYSVLGLMAVAPIYVGSYKSIKFTPRKKGDAEEESFSMQDAKMFPFIGSASLFGLYLIFKYVDKDIVNYVVTCYFTVLGVAASATLLLDISRFAQDSQHLHRYASGLALKGNYVLSLHKLGKPSPSSEEREPKEASYTLEQFSYYFGYYHLILLVIASLVGAYYAVTKHWLISNFYGEAFALNAIQLLNLDSFKTGIMLLGGLFFYDVFWVFGTEVMVTVAKNFDAPIKVVFPKDIWEVLSQGLFSRTAKLPFTMLGLGDIVIPGIFVALCLQFDYYMHKKRSNGKVVTVGASRFDFPQPYFYSCFFAYFIGLFTTVYIMHNFNTPQVYELFNIKPALLYLSPACSIAPLLVAFFRGELKDLFAFNPTEEAGKKKLEEEVNLLSADDEDDDEPAAISTSGRKQRKSKKKSS